MSEDTLNKGWQCWRWSSKFWSRHQWTEATGGQWLLRARVSRFVRPDDPGSFGPPLGELELTGTLFRWEVFHYDRSPQLTTGEERTLVEAQGAADQALGLQSPAIPKRKKTWKPVERALARLDEALGEE